MSKEEQINTELQTLENMNELLKKDTDAVAKIKEETPTEKVEKRLTDFVADAFKATISDFAFIEAVKQDGLRRLSSMSDNMYIGFLGALQVNNNDRISKLISPLATMMTSKQQAEIAAAQKAAQMQVIVGQNNQNGGGGNLNEQVTGEKEEVRDVLTGANVLSQLLTALGQGAAQEGSQETSDTPEQS